ncbi:thioredoxin family protein [Vibrio sp. SM6]|uniref:Thioredoxin family protein n=1 Tax=Vibrio agarilyticus TaxID=2726741 RepID=A0A7X8YGG0_9VIBR|nr:thioredoxin family protein [Vibrio agarilyticus]NLS12505.1 thioredoxin family protein [Vibrio agarilyticus]
MKTIEVYGTGCKNCVVTAERISEVANELGLSIEVRKVTALEHIMAAGIMSTPGVGVNGQVKHTGSVPSMEQIRAILTADSQTA